MGIDLNVERALMYSRSRTMSEFLTDNIWNVKRWMICSEEKVLGIT